MKSDIIKILKQQAGLSTREAKVIWAEINIVLRREIDEIYKEAYLGGFSDGAGKSNKKPERFDDLK